MRPPAGPSAASAVGEEDAAAATTPLLWMARSSSSSLSSSDQVFHDAMQQQPQPEDAEDDSSNFSTGGNPNPSAVLLPVVEVAAMEEEEARENDCRFNSFMLIGLVAMGSSLGGILSIASQFRSSSSTPDVPFFSSSFVLQTLSACLGYTYFLMWSVSFYPQVWQNYRRRSTHGLSVDFCVLNGLGFLCYAIYNVAFYYWSPWIQHHHQQALLRDTDTTNGANNNNNNNSATLIPVQFNDVAFAIHALLLSSVTLLQIGYYNNGFFQCRGWQPRIHSDVHNYDGNNNEVMRIKQPSKLVLVIVMMALFVIFGYPVAYYYDMVTTRTTTHTSHSILGISPLDYLYGLSYIKMAITFVKYCPQVYMNWRRQSTVGWSIRQIILDFGGGLFSLTQLVLDCAVTQDLSGIVGNLAKFFLGLVSMVFDVIFLWQHYILYPLPLSTSQQILLPVDENSHDDVPTGNSTDRTNEALLQPDRQQHV